jgi:hypothetical protein
VGIRSASYLFPSTFRGTRFGSSAYGIHQQPVASDRSLGRLIYPVQPAAAVPVSIMLHPTLPPSRRNFRTHSVPLAITDAVSFIRVKETLLVR